MLGLHAHASQCTAMTAQAAVPEALPRIAPDSSSRAIRGAWQASVPEARPRIAQRFNVGWAREMG